MLAKIVKPRPDFLPLGAIDGGTAEASVSAVLWHDLVNTLLVSIKIIVGAKTINLGASRYIAFVGLFVSEHMLSVPILPTSTRQQGSLHEPTYVPSDSWKQYYSFGTGRSNQKPK